MISSFLFFECLYPVICTHNISLLACAIYLYFRNYIILFSIHWRGFNRGVFRIHARPHPTSSFGRHNRADARESTSTSVITNGLYRLHINMVLCFQNLPPGNKVLQPVQRMVVKFHQLGRVLKIFRTDNDFRVVVLI